MNRAVLSVLLSVLAVGVVSTVGCSDDSEKSAQTTITARTTTTALGGPFFTFDEVGLGPDGYATLTNFTGGPQSLAGYYLCQEGKCFALPAVDVGGKKSVGVAVGDGDGIEDVIATDATIGKLRSSDGELALYASDDFDDPNAMQAYVEWGSTPHERTPLAIKAGLWLKGSYAPTAPNAVRLYRSRGGLWLFETG